MKKIDLIVIVVLSVIGIAMLLGAGWFWDSSSSFTKTALKVEGTVIDLIPEDSSDNNSRTVVWYPMVEFTSSDGRMVTFKSHTGSNPPMYGKGQKVTVLYNPVNPDSAMIDSFMDLWFGSVLLGFIGTFFSAIGLGLWIAHVTKVKKVDWLNSNGLRIQAGVKRIGVDGSISERGVSPYRIISQYMDKATNKVYVFESEPIWFDPSEFVGESIDVLVDPADYNRYYVDISFLPKS